MKQIAKLTILFILLLALAACSEQPEVTATAVPPTSPPAEAEAAETAIPETEAVAVPETTVSSTENVEVNDATPTEAVERTENSDTNEEHAAVLTPGDCPVPPFTEGEVEGDTYFCGTAEIPENYDDPSGNKVELAYAVLKASGSTPSPDPVIFLHGGPGSGAMLYLSQMIEDLATVRQDRDVIIFDQRGAGFSNASLDCSVELVNQQDQIAAIVAEASAEDALNVQQEQIVQTCFEAARQHGIDLTQYNTINNARDVQSLVAALGYDSFNLYGFSYGTELAQEILRQNPVGLRSVIVDSVVPLNIKFHERAAEPAVESAQALFAGCAADAACNAAYPDLESRFNALMLALEESPIVLFGGESISPKEVAALFLKRNNHLLGSGISAYLPRMISELEQGITDTYTGLDNGTLPPQILDADEEFVADEDLEEPNGQEFTLAQTFNHMIFPLIESPEANSDLKRAYFTLVQQPATQATLLDFINVHMADSDNSEFLKSAKAMSDDDVGELFAMIHKSIAFQPFSVEAAFVFPFRLFVCNEAVPYNTLEGAKAAIDSAAVPAMTIDVLDSIINSIGKCGDLPTGQEPASYHDSVSSDIPTLIMVGLNDIQTTPSWGEILLENLSDGKLVVFPESGHGVFQFSQCVKDVAADFFNQPEAMPDSSCTDNLTVEFVLPE